MKNNTLMKLLSFALLLTMFGCGWGKGKGKDKNGKAINDQADPKSILEIQGSDISGSTTKFAIKVANKDAKKEFDLKGYKLKAEVVKVNDGTDLKGVTLKYQKGGLNMSSKSITNQIETLLSNTKLAANGTSSDMEFELDTKSADSIEVKFTMTDAKDKEITTKALKWTKGATQVATATIMEANFTNVEAKEGKEGKDAKASQTLRVRLRVKGKVEVASCAFSIQKGDGEVKNYGSEFSPHLEIEDKTHVIKAEGEPQGTFVAGQYKFSGTLTLKDNSTISIPKATVDLKEAPEGEDGK